MCDGQNFYYLGHKGRWGRTLSDRPLSEASLISAAGGPDTEEAY